MPFINEVETLDAKYIDLIDIEVLNPALGKMKSRKTPGTDNINVELTKYR